MRNSLLFSHLSRYLLLFLKWYFFLLPPLNVSSFVLSLNKFLLTAYYPQALFKALVTLEEQNRPPPPKKISAIMKLTV